METRKETLSSIKLCRFCLAQGDTLTSIYEKRATKNTVSLPLKILSCVSIEVFPSDKMPTYICTRCKFFMEISYDFKHLCRQADEHILQYIQNATPLSAVTWPQSLHKLFRVANKAPEVPLMKTIIEGGTTVQVTAQESDTDEEDDENVYNVKIGDGSDDGSKSARVKVITATGKQDKGKAKRGKDQEATNRTEMVINQKLDSESQENWPCNQCECAYPVEKLLKMHRLQKHGDRNVECGSCETDSIDTYDMMTHQLAQAVKLNFQCVACGKQFTRLKMLKKHEKIEHADLVQQPCQSCPATFLSLDELEAHQKQHLNNSNNAEKLFVCKICKKRFFEKAMLHKHEEKMHNRKPPHASKYNSSRFTATANLSRHVRAHADGRSYPCKNCNKSFVKSHHLTRHLRLKHRENIRTCRGPFGESDQYRCEQCEDSFATQDELIYHSAIHATQNLICPLCQEKFEDVDAVTAHIKSHVNGTEFMCDLCELVFTSKEKLDAHLTIAHDDELHSVPDLLQDESSMEMDADEDEEDAGIHVKELDDHMVVEIKKTNEFLLSNTQDESEEKLDNTNSEESDTEVTLPDLMAVDDLPIANKHSGKGTPEKMPVGGTPIVKPPSTPPKNISKVDSQTASILRKAEEVKKKVIQHPTQELVPVKKEKIEKTNSNNAGSNDKSLRLLEKELQELKRTNTRSEATKTPVKPIESLRSRRAQIHTSTPKLKTPTEEKKTQVAVKSPAIEKKLPERRVVTKENKEPKEIKDVKANNKEDKEKEIKEKESKDKETPKSLVKNGSERSVPEEAIRRSTRPSKIKDYAKMIRDRSQDSDDNYDTDDTDDEEYKDTDRSVEIKPKARRASVKTPAPKPAPSPAIATPTPRKRGRPRKDAVAPKVRKEEIEEAATITEVDKDKSKSNAEDAEKELDNKDKDNKDTSTTTESSKPIAEQKPATLVSPTGQTLKKIPIKSLPPGVKPMPLPVNARPIAGGEVCEMQIGKKVVKVQKIVMTKAEVEAMAKKGLVEMKDGTMVLKQGIKIPTVDAASLKTSLVGEDANKESPSKKDKAAAPSRCDLGEDL